MFECAFHYTNFEIRYSGNHTPIKDELYLYFFYMHSVVKITMAMAVSDAINLLFSYVILLSMVVVVVSRYAGVAHDWAASVMKTCRSSLSVISAA